MKISGTIIIFIIISAAISIWVYKGDMGAIRYKGNEIHLGRIDAFSILFVEKPIKRFLTISTSFNPDMTGKAISADYKALSDIVLPLRGIEPEVTFFMVDKEHINAVPIKGAEDITQGKAGVIALVSSQEIDDELFQRIMDVLLDERWTR